MMRERPVPAQNAKQWLVNLAREANERDRYSIFLLALVVFGFFLPALMRPQLLIWPNSGLGSDIGVRHWADLVGYAANWRSGRLPLWDPFSVMGRPLAGDTAVLFLYPFDVLFMFLPPAFAFSLNDAIHVFLAGMFTFLLARIGHNLSRPAALFSGLAFAFMPKLISHLAGGHVGVVWGLAWSPAVFLGLTLAFKKGSFLAAALAALALAIPMSTHVQQPFYTGVIGTGLWVCYGAGLVLKRYRGERVPWRQVGRLIAVYVFWLIMFVMLAAFELLPLIEILPFNNRASFTAADANHYALPPPLLLTILAPSEFQFPEWTMFLGMLPMTLAVLGWWKSNQPAKHPLALFAIASAVYAIGTVTPLFGLTYELVPGFKLLRVPTRLWFFGGGAVLLLAGFGVDALTNSRLRDWLRERRQWLARILAMYLAANAVTQLLYRLLVGQWHEVLFSQLMVILLVALLGAVWLLKPIDARVIQWSLIPILLLDLLPVDASFIGLVNPAAVFLHSTPALDFISAQPGAFRVYSPAAGLPYAVAAQRNVEWLEGLLSFQIDHAIRVIRDASGCTKIGYATAAPPCLDDRAPVAVPDAEKLGRLNVRYLYTNFPLNARGFALVFSGSPSVYENLAWQPRARLSGAGGVNIVERHAGEYEIAVSVPAASVLVVVETWLPGWQAKVDGQSRPVAQVEGALLGIEVRPGDQLVHLQYSPVGWRIGWPITLLSLALLGLWCLVAWLHNSA